MTSTRRTRSSDQNQGTRQGEAPPSGLMGIILVAVAVALGVILLVKGGGIGFESDSKNVSIGGKNNKGPVETTTTTTPLPSTSVPAAELKIAVLNGAGKSGFAALGANFLSVAGYPTVNAGNAAARVTTSSVYFAPGFDNDAAAVAKVLNITEVKAIPETPLGRSAADVPAGTAVVVMLGPDAEAVINASGANTTTTTAGGATTTTTPTKTTTTKASGGG